MEGSTVETKKSHGGAYSYFPGLPSPRDRYQGMRDLCKVCLPELLEHVSEGEVLEADSNLSICINFKLLI